MVPCPGVQGKPASNTGRGVPRVDFLGLKEMEAAIDRMTPNCLDFLIKPTRQVKAYINTTLKVIKARFQRKLKDNCPLVTRAAHK